MTAAVLKEACMDLVQGDMVCGYKRPVRVKETTSSTTVAARHTRKPRPSM